MMWVVNLLQRDEPRLPALLGLFLVAVMSVLHSTDAMCQHIGEGWYRSQNVKFLYATPSYGTEVEETMYSGDEVYLTNRTVSTETSTWCQTQAGMWISDIGLKRIEGASATVENMLNAMVREAYNRTLEEIRASHLLVRVSEEATPSDTLMAWNKAIALKERIASGEDFAVIASSPGSNDDPSVMDYGGDVGWFSAFRMVHPFEDACYKASVGDLVGPVRTRFGYHVIEVTGRRESRGKIRVAHILIRPDEANGGDEVAKAKIDALAAELAFGADFSLLAQQHSADLSSRPKGGELPMFGLGRMVRPFEEAAFALTTDGDLSEPVKTQYGWHIIKRLQYKAPPTFEESKEELWDKLIRDSRTTALGESIIRAERLRNGIIDEPTPSATGSETSQSFNRGTGVQEGTSGQSATSDVRREGAFSTGESDLSSVPIRFRQSEAKSPIEVVAVLSLDGTNCTNESTKAKDEASVIEQELLGAYGIVDRSHLEMIMEEQRLALSGLVMEEGSLAKAGCLAGAQGTVIVTKGCLLGDDVITIKMLDCTSSMMYWVASGPVERVYDIMGEVRAQLK